jgi:hypothetical protein
MCALVVREPAIGIANFDVLARKLLGTLEYRVLNGLSDPVDRRQVILDAGAYDLDANAQQDEG